MGNRNHDWSWSRFSTAEPDGIARTHLIWITRFQEPLVFSLGGKLRNLEAERRQAIRDFIAQR